MAESDDQEQRALQERQRLKQSEGTTLGPERSQFWNAVPPTDEQPLTVIPTLESPAVINERAARLSERLFAFGETIVKPRDPFAERIEGLTRAIAELREHVAENTRAIAELKKAVEKP